MKILLKLFFSFAKISVFTFGGGYSMLPLLIRELVHNRGWATEDEIIDFFAIGQCVPGVISVNVASFVGIKVAGSAGSSVAALGMVFPPIIIILALSSLISSFTEFKTIQSALWGIRVAVCAMLTITAGGLIKKAATDAPTIFIVLFAFTALLINISPAIIILVSAAIGYAVKFVITASKGNKK
ncbi:MAG: chromate transporter [Eubacterium sp.]|nr:chromate transporter [Eubacterium sp.]